MIMLITDVYANDEVGVPLELSDSNVKDLVEEERSKLQRAQLYTASTSQSPLAQGAKRNKQAEMHNEL